MLPTYVFIVPYRDREYQKAVFLSHMKEILKGDSYEITFVHQKDKRTFNRGAMKNIGFIYYKKKYPNIWKDLTFIFHDIDCIPYKKLFDYDTIKGTIKHFYGFKFALGGIFSIKGIDFERINGFPNYWGWGFEDNKLKDKWDKVNGKMNYEQFIFYTDNRVVKLDVSNKEPGIRIVNGNNLTYAMLESMTASGIHTIRNLDYNIQDEENIIMINVTSFLVEKEEKQQRIIKDVTREMIRKDFKIRTKRANNRYRKPKMTMGFHR